MTIREELEIIELGTLCEDACTSKHTGRRVRPEPQCPIRTDFSVTGTGYFTAMHSAALNIKLRCSLIP